MAAQGAGLGEGLVLASDAGVRGAVRGYLVVLPFVAGWAMGAVLLVSGAVLLVGPSLIARPRVVSPEPDQPV